MIKTNLPAACVVVGLLLAQGCAFHREVVNGSVKKLDTSFIRVGQTTATEVFAKLGPPPPSSDVLNTQGVATDDYLRYACQDTRRTRLLFGYVVFFPFQWMDTQMVDEYVITLDENRVVTDVIHTKRDTVRPPLESESARLPLQCVSAAQKGVRP
jgi:hypothetical protein